MRCWKRVSSKSALAAAIATVAVVVPHLALATIIPWPSSTSLVGDDFNESDAGPSGLNTFPPAMATGALSTSRTPDYSNLSSTPNWAGDGIGNFVNVGNVSGNIVNTDSSSTTNSGRTSCLRNGGGATTAAAYLPVSAFDAGYSDYTISADVERVGEGAETGGGSYFAGLYLGRNDSVGGSSTWNYFGNTSGTQANNGQMLIGLVEGSTTSSWNFVVEQSGGTFGAGSNGVETFALTNNSSPATTGFNAGNWNNVSVNVNFATNTISAYLNGSLEATVTPTISLTQGGSGAGSIGTFGMETTASASSENYFDNFNVQGVVVPEPASTGLVVFAGALLMRRRSSRVCSAKGG